MKDGAEPGRRGPLILAALLALAALHPAARAQDTPPPEEAAPAEPEEAMEQAEPEEAEEPVEQAAPEPAAALPVERRGISLAELNRGRVVQIGDLPDDQTALSAWRASGPQPGTHAVGSIAGRAIAINADGEILAIISSPVTRSGPIQRPPSKPPRQ